jgi:LysR family hydrogen peroxide-inducible transcriptional activator
MELHQLRYVIAVAETGSFSRAAEHLFVVQSNVSAQIRKLEREVGVPLFERRAHDVVITEFGRAFLPRARQALAALEDARAAVDAVRGLTLGKAELGIIGTVAGWLLPGLAQRFRASHPLVDLWLTEEPTVVLAEMVASRRLPQALVNLPVPQAEQLNTEVLFLEELVVVVPPDHRLRGTAEAPLEWFRDDDWLLPEPGNALRGLIAQALGSAGYMPTPRIQVGKKQLMQDLAIAGVGVALLPAATALHPLGPDTGRIIRVSEPKVIRSVGLVTHRTRSRSPGDMALDAVLRDVISERCANADALPGTIAVQGPGGPLREAEPEPMTPIAIR